MSFAAATCSIVSDGIAIFLSFQPVYRGKLSA